MLHSGSTRHRKGPQWLGNLPEALAAWPKPLAIRQKPWQLAKTLRNLARTIRKVAKTFRSGSERFVVENFFLKVSAGPTCSEHRPAKTISINFRGPGKPGAGQEARTKTGQAVPEFQRPRGGLTHGIQTPHSRIFRVMAFYEGRVLHALDLVPASGSHEIT